jgi:RNA polymerase sigma factor (sigma-70 family)
LPKHGRSSIPPPGNHPGDGKKFKNAGRTRRESRESVDTPLSWVWRHSCSDSDPAMHAADEANGADAGGPMAGRAEAIMKSRTTDTSSAPMTDRIEPLDPADAGPRQKLAEALASLGEKYREVFILRDVEQLSIEETAKALGISIPSVKTRLLRARLMLRDLLAPGFGGGWASKLSFEKGNKPW